MSLIMSKHDSHILSKDLSISTNAVLISCVIRLVFGAHKQNKNVFFRGERISK